MRILITGASSGIGAALAQAYADAGSELVLFGRDAARLEATARLCRAKGARVETEIRDVRDRAAMAAAIEAADARGALDLVVANAGVSSVRPREAAVEAPEAARAVLAINLFGAMNTLEPAVRLMAARGRGHVAATGSLAGLRGLPWTPAYCAAKAGLKAWIEALRVSAGAHGVAVTLILPGFVEVPALAQARAVKPGAMSPARAAAILRRGLDRRRRTIAFPLFLYWAILASRLIPGPLADRILRAIPVEGPATGERQDDSAPDDSAPQARRL